MLARGLCCGHDDPYETGMTRRRRSHPQSSPSLRCSFLEVIPFFNSESCSIEKSDPNSPTSPHAKVFAIGPWTVYLSSSLTNRICLTVSGWEYMWVFMAGKRSTGTKVGRARRTEVCENREVTTFRYLSFQMICKPFV
ncbi:BQ5605_C004g02629 [Microbotryum silenes-dioicae]|uniref:BQ5605_C004g02629 protein n=1 Tax=Microbotryum silenes-dioicae TaxID=796604 RepID=A0A2X0MBM2_9BASI|nr:BQ5605_C004g02629 [Microbotryum silenes-dioicae]